VFGLCVDYHISYTNMPLRGFSDPHHTTAYDKSLRYCNMVHQTLDERRVSLEEALEEAQATGNSAREAACRRRLYKLLLEDAPLECDLSSVNTLPTPAGWPISSTSQVASLMEQVQAMPSGQNWLDVTAGKLMVPACPPELRQASFKQQLGEAIQNHEATLAIQEGRKARKFNYSKWIFRA